MSHEFHELDVKTFVTFEIIMLVHLVCFLKTISEILSCFLNVNICIDLYFIFKAKFHIKKSTRLFSFIQR